ncbi:hypothetical protein BLNAU_19232 [Blattamonas nauphoetae]|uniref:Uncharacterized protein n=1 Tax=Blattamonas nauphoetae TaxID=2049346 RepID=A0ABQ9X3D7_9EUKA|nr:hypothetical protein BLNAU_19232 [Blattamonas nauphoetae]
MLTSSDEGWSSVEPTSFALPLFSSCTSSNRTLLVSLTFINRNIPNDARTNDVDALLGMEGCEEVRTSDLGLAVRLRSSFKLCSTVGLERHSATAKTERVHSLQTLVRAVWKEDEEERR